MKRRMQSTLRRAGLLVLLLAAVPVVGCGSGGSGGGLAALCIAFQAAGAATPATVVANEGAGSQCDEVEVSVEMTGVADVYTVSFQVAFDPLVASYEGFSIAGSHLASDGANVQVLESSGTGWVSLGVTRINTTTGIDFGGSGTVVKLLFSAVSNSTPTAGSFDFAGTQVFGSEAPPLEKNGIQWFDGTLVVE